MIRSHAALLLCGLGWLVSCSDGNDHAAETPQPARLFEKVDWTAQTRIDRVGRPLMNLVFIDALATAAGFDHAQMLDAYNDGSPDAPDDFIQPIAGTLSLLDAADGQCGNQLGSQDQPDESRYLPLGALLADDRLYIGTSDDACNGFLGLELAELSGQGQACGGRTPTDPAVDTLYSLAMGQGAEALAVDGLEPSTRSLSDSPPFLSMEP